VHHQDVDAKFLDLRSQGGSISGEEALGRCVEGAEGTRDETGGRGGEGHQALLLLGNHFVQKVMRDPQGACGVAIVVLERPSE